MGLASSLAKKFTPPLSPAVSRPTTPILPQSKEFTSTAVWSRADWVSEWDDCFTDVNTMVAAANRNLACGNAFAPQEWKVLEVIYATSGAAKVANNMLGYRDALARYRAAAKHFLKLTD